MTSSDMFHTFMSISGKKQLKETVTPHKVALLVMIKEYCMMINKYKNASEVVNEEETKEYSKKQTRSIALNTLRFIQTPDMALKEMCTVIEDTLTPKFNATFKLKLKELYDQSVAGFMEHIQSVEILMVDPTLSIPVVHKSSVIGLFLRRMLLAFDKMSFSQVTKLYRNFKQYYEAAHNVDKSEDEACHEIIRITCPGVNSSLDVIDVENENDKCKGPVSHKQAEYFISQQAALIQSNEKEALSPAELQKQIHEMLKAHPDLAEAHFLSYLNKLRVKEYCGAVRHLYNCFDRNTLANQDNKSSADDVGRSFRYAALTLASLHCRFGHREEALAALREAIRMAQETNDNICLQHALSWLYRLETDGTDILLERSIAKSGDLNLSYLTSLGVQAFTQHKAVLSTQPSQVFEFIMKSDILNCQHSMLELMANSYAQKSALWHMYGQSGMSSLQSQLLLHLNTSDPTRKGLYHSGDGICFALRNVAMQFAQHGEMNSAREIIAYAQQSFPSYSEHSSLWMLAEQMIRFDQALLHSNWHEAEVTVQNMAVINPVESNLRLAQMYLYRGDFTNASKLILKLLNGESLKETSAAEHRARVLILQSELHILSGNYSAAISPLMQGLTICQQHYLEYMLTFFTLHIANVQLLLGLPSQALTLLDQIMVTIFTCGSVYDRGRAHFLYAKCVLACENTKAKDCAKDEAACLSAINLLSSAIEDFTKVEAHHRIKDALYIQARLYHELGFTEERNRCALKFRQLDQQHESPFQPRIQFL